MSALSAHAAAQRDAAEIKHLRRKSATLTEHGIYPTDAEDAPSASIANLQRLLSHSINLRDLGGITELVMSGIVFRSSQVVAPSQLKRLGVKTIIDLRKASRACNVQSANVQQSIARAARRAWLWIRNCIKQQPIDPEDLEALLKQEVEVKEAAPCWRCTEAGEEQYGVEARVYHVDLLPGLVSLFILAALPGRLQAKVIYLKLTGRHPEPQVAAAVANPRVMGYFKLYKIILERSKANLASALRLLICEDHLPVVIHCVHGKDRTGLLVMIIYLLCDVPRHVIVHDYAQSESLLKQGRDSRLLFGLPEEFTTDEIMASAAGTMEATLDYLHAKYNDVHNYLRSAGMMQVEIDRIKAKLIETLNG